MNYAMQGKERSRVFEFFSLSATPLFLPSLAGALLHKNLTIFLAGKFVLAKKESSSALISHS
jgi:hypothetical protein